MTPKIMKRITINNVLSLHKPERQIVQYIRFILFLFLFNFTVNYVSAQVGIQTDNPDPSSALEIVSTNKGLLIPRVTLTASLESPSPVVAPATGLLIYNSGPNQEEGFYFWAGTIWKMLKPADANDVEGPDFSTDNAVARFNGTDGTLIQNSSVIIDDAGNMTGVNNITTSGFRMPTAAGVDKVLSSDASGNGTWEDALPLDIEQSDAIVAPAVNTLNFQGAVDVVDNGNNKATVTISQSISEEEVIQLSSTTSIDVNGILPVTIPWDIEVFKDDGTFSHSTLSRPSRVIVLSDGTYEVNYMFSIENEGNQRKTLRSRVRVNGLTYLESSSAYAFTYSKFDDRTTLVSSSFLLDLNANDYIEILVNGQTNEGPVNMIPNESLLFVRILRSW